MENCYVRVSPHNPIRAEMNSAQPQINVDHDMVHIYPKLIRNLMKKVNQSRYRPGGPQRVPGS